MKKHRWLVLLALLVAAFAVAGCGDDDDDDGGGGNGGGAATSEEAAGQIQSNADNSATEITIGSKNFTEQKILGEISPSRSRRRATPCRRS
jgi:osmoprotectant transport system substrate-binding protein